MDWTYSVLESWGKDREGTTEVNLENRGPSTTAQRRREAKIWGIIEKTGDTERE